MVGEIDIDGTIPSRRASAASTRSTIPGAVELPPIVVRKDGGRASIISQIRGQLVEVNPGHSFVVLDKGSWDGVNVGMAFDVLRGTRTVGQATVVRVRPQLAAAVIRYIETALPQ